MSSPSNSLHLSYPIHWWLLTTDWLLGQFSRIELVEWTSNKFPLVKGWYKHLAYQWTYFAVLQYVRTITSCLFQRKPSSFVTQKHKKGIDYLNENIHQSSLYVQHWKDIPAHVINCGDDVISTWNTMHRFNSCVFNSIKFSLFTLFYLY